MPPTPTTSPTLAALLGIQLQQHLADLQRALPSGYLQTVDAKPTSPKAAAAAAAGAAPDPGIMLEREGGRSGKGATTRSTGAFNQPVPEGGVVAVPAMPAGTGDQVVTPKPAKGKKGAARTMYLTQQVPVLDERGVQVDVVGPKGAPFMPQVVPATAGVAPIPNARPDIKFDEGAAHGFGYLRQMHDNIQNALNAKYGTWL